MLYEVSVIKNVVVLPFEAVKWTGGYRISAYSLVHSSTANCLNSTSAFQDEHSGFSLLIPRKH